MMVKVFRTNIQHQHEAQKILESLVRSFPEYQINFDLSDCDKVLRIASKNGAIDSQEIILLVKQQNFEIDTLF